jgi:polyferredoxin
MKSRGKAIIYFSIVIAAGLIPAMVCQFFTKGPTDRYIQIRSFRYGKDPSVIRCNRGDRLHLTFTTDDTGHSFFLEEFDMDVKVSPAREEVAVFKTSDPTMTPVLTREYTFIARHPGIKNYLVARSNYRCHVWCGPMHAFEQGKLIILPNTLLLFSLGSICAIFLLWILSIFRRSEVRKQPVEDNSAEKDLLLKSGFLRKLVVSRWPQAILTILAMVMIYIVILTSLFGTLMSGRNLGVLLMWAVWLFLLVAVMTPFIGRAWCTICPLPLFGDLFQRRSFFVPQRGRTKEYNNKFSGLFLKWPGWLKNDWTRLMVFLILATFSTTLVANPRASAMAVIGLLLVPTLMSVIWELRAFCRYVCPVSVFVGPYARMSPIALRSKSMQVCEECKPRYCQKGSPKGWACPYGINVGEMNENSDCGLCLECTRSCLYNNVSVFKRPLATELGTRNRSEAWMTMAILTLAIVYSILYEGHWPVVRDFVNILDKHNWGLFGIYSIALSLLSMVIMPGIIYLLANSAITVSKSERGIREVFLKFAGVLLPLGLALWIAFVIPMFFVNVTFILQSLSDPFGWGWDFFGTANIPWHQFLPEMTPWMQSAVILAGTYLSLRNLKNTFNVEEIKSRQLFLITLPLSLFLLVIAVVMIFFFTN